jgi:hypothetical protein
MSQRQQLERIFEIDRSIRIGEYPKAERLAEKLETGQQSYCRSGSGRLPPGGVD